MTENQSQFHPKTNHAQTLYRTTCPHDCPSVCALEVEKLSATRIGKVLAAKEQTYTQGVLCAKVARYRERVHHPERLTTPLLRVGAKGVGREAFIEISWQEALDRLAEKFTDITQTHGSQAIWPYYYSGTMGLIQRDSILRLTHALGYSRQKNTICVALGDAGYIAGTGVKRGVDAREVEHSKLIVIWGGNPVHTQINFMHHVIKAQIHNNAKLVVIDPYTTPTAKKADLHIRLKPGTDGALAAAVMHYLFANDLADWDYLNKYTDDPHGLAYHVRDKTLAWASAITGVSVGNIECLARWYGETKAAYMRLCHGFTRSRNGALNMHAALSLPAVTGAWQYQGGGALYGQSGLYNLDTSHIKSIDLCNSAIRVLDQSRIGPILTGCETDLVGQGPVKAMIIQNTNPMVVTPQSNLVKAGMSRDDLWLCVHEQFMTETAAMADIVLPATMFLEHDDIYTASAHTHIQLGRKIIEGPALCRSNSWVINQLGQRLGVTHEAFMQDDMTMIEDLVTRSGYDWSRLLQDNWLDCALPFDDAHFKHGFAHADGKFHFRHGWDALGKQQGKTISPFPDHNPIIDAATAKRPWRLVAAPAKHYLNTSFNECPSSAKLEKRADVLMCPEDAASLEINTDDWVTLGNESGEVTLQVTVSDQPAKNTLVCESLWPNKAFAGGTGINTLISAEAGFPYGGAVFHDTSVWVRKATATLL